ncbi:MAG TPA: glycosyl transferase family 2 [Vicinamibacteria bacterium]|nr:glycosyl transferase family 2 [Vicinamibacteria bacterium]
MTLLREDLRSRLDEMGEVDIVVGIPSFNSARTIAHVVRAVAGGLAKYFPDRKSVIVNSDGGSTDGTHEAVMGADIDHDSLLLVSHRVPTIQKITTPYHGIPGKGSAFRTIFAVTERLNAKACVVVDSDLRSITPHWVELLAAPVLDRGFDYIAPFYLRHKYDGTITNSIIYPMTRTLFGRRIRQPIGGDFGLSGKVASRFLTKDVWETDVARYGIDIWMTLTAMAEGFRVGQSYLGAKLHDAKDPGADLTAMFRQVVSSLFGLMETYETVWQKVGSSEPVPMFGLPFDVGLEPIPVDVERMKRAFQQGLRDLDGIYRSFLSPSTVEGLVGAALETGDGFRVPDALWVRLVYEFAAAYHGRLLDRDHLLQSLIPLYLGRTGSFVLDVQIADAVKVEEQIESLAREFEAQKPYLLECWSAQSKRR